MAELDTEYATAGSGAAESIPVQASALRRGQFVLIKDHPCKIVDMSSSKTGKHGHAKIHFVALDIFDGKKYEDICPSTHNMKAPIVNREECQAIGYDDGFVNLTKPNGDTTDIKAPDELQEEIENFIENEGSCLVTVLTSMGQEKIISVKAEK